MSSFWIKTLLAIFFAHLCIFFFLYIKKRKAHHLMVSTTFALLVLSFSSRIWTPDITLFGHNLHTLFRLSAWVSTTVVLLMVAKDRIALGTLSPKYQRSRSPRGLAASEKE